MVYKAVFMVCSPGSGGRLSNCATFKGFNFFAHNNIILAITPYLIY